METLRHFRVAVRPPQAFLFNSSFNSLFNGRSNVSCQYTNKPPNFPIHLISIVHSSLTWLTWRRRAFEMCHHFLTIDPFMHREFYWIKPFAASVNAKQYTLVDIVHRTMERTFLKFPTEVLAFISCAIIKTKWIPQNWWKCEIHLWHALLTCDPNTLSSFCSVF